MSREQIIIAVVLVSVLMLWLGGCAWLPDKINDPIIECVYGTKCRL